MGVIVHTAQLNVGKVLKLADDVLFLDVTVKSGDDWIKNTVAPTWELLRAYKAHCASPENEWCDDAAYTREYLQSLSRINTEFELFIKLLDEQGIKAIVLGCYCGCDKFCHRHLLQRYLIERFGLELGWEIKSSDIELTRKPKSFVISIDAPATIRTEIAEAVRNDLPDVDCYSDLNDPLFNGALTVPVCKDDDLECQMERSIALILRGELILQQVKHHHVDGLVIDNLGVLASIDSIESTSKGLAHGIWTTVAADTATEAISKINRVGYYTDTQISKPAINAEFDARMCSLYSAV